MSEWKSPFDYKFSNQIDQIFTKNLSLKQMGPIYIKTTRQVPLFPTSDSKDSLPPLWLSARRKIELVVQFLIKKHFEGSDYTRPVTIQTAIKAKIFPLWKSRFVTQRVPSTIISDEKR